VKYRRVEGGTPIGECSTYEACIPLQKGSAFLPTRSQVPPRARLLEVISQTNVHQKKISQKYFTFINAPKSAVAHLCISSGAALRTKVQTGRRKPLPRSGRFPDFRFLLREVGHEHGRNRLIGCACIQSGVELQVQAAAEI
jgi:hypothetical protein